MPDRERQRLVRAKTSLEGVSVGDSFGETFFIHPDLVEGMIEERALASRMWNYTDDTMMAMSIVSVLRQDGRIDQDALARSFADHYDRNRGYGPAMHRLLWEIKCGEDWRERAGALFGGQGSFGNGAAMRVGPLGAYFADDLGAVVEQSALSSTVTHTHEEAVAGAIAVAVSAALAARLRGESNLPSREEFLDLVLPNVPQTEVRRQIQQAKELPPETTVSQAVSLLGNGSRVSAQDTVPFALWCAATHLDDFEEALWLTVSGLGDRDTTCAIVGSIVAAYTGIEGIPPHWLKAREPLPAWFGASVR